MARLLWADRKEAATHTTTRFNQGVQNSSVNSQLEADELQQQKTTQGTTSVS